MTVVIYTLVFIFLLYFIYYIIHFQEFKLDPFAMWDYIDKNSNLEIRHVISSLRIKFSITKVQALHLYKAWCKDDVDAYMKEYNKIKRSKYYKL